MLQTGRRDSSFSCCGIAGCTDDAATISNLKGRNASKLSGKRDAKAPSKVLETARGSSAGKAGTELNKVLKSLMANSSEPGSSGPGPSSMAQIDQLEGLSDHEIDNFSKSEEGAWGTHMPFYPD